MNHHDSDDDFIDGLYQQSAKETPPAQLDKQILSLAKLAHQPSPFAKMMRFQRVLSVAAVMVLSIAIFFEVDKNATRYIEQDAVTPQQNRLQSPPSAPASDQIDQSVEMHESSQGIEQDSAEQNPTKQLKSKAMKKAFKEQQRGFMADEISELAAEEQSAVGAASRSASAPSDSLKMEAPNQDQKPDLMLQDIEALLASGQVEEARILFEQFKQRYPKYAVPELIREQIGKGE